MLIQLCYTVSRRIIRQPRYTAVLCKTCIDEDSSFNFPESFGGVHIEEYNRAIREAAFYQNCSLLDLASYNIPYASMDGTHPTKKGMNTLAELVVRGILQDRYASH